MKNKNRTTDESELSKNAGYDRAKENLHKMQRALDRFRPDPDEEPVSTRGQWHPNQSSISKPA